MNKKQKKMAKTLTLCISRKRQIKPGAKGKRGYGRFIRVTGTYCRQWLFAIWICRIIDCDNIWLFFDNGQFHDNWTARVDPFETGGHIAKVNHINHVKIDHIEYFHFLVDY